MKIELTNSFYKDLDNYGSYRRVRVFTIENWNSELMGPSPEVRYICDMLPSEGEERYYTLEFPLEWD